MSSEPVISARQLGKAYRFYKRPLDRLRQMAWRGRRRYYEEFWALRGIDLDIERGDTLGIIGRNGAGKSTLLQLLCGTLSPSEGACRVNGRVAALLELGAGFNPEFTGRDNVFVNAAILGLSEEQIRARFDDIAAFADIGPFIDHPVKTYSSGMYVRLAFAVATSVQPDILIVDEALAVGDMLFQAKCVHRIRQMLAGGTTLLFVSHDPDAVRTLCRRCLWLEGGRTKLLDDSRAVSEQYLAAVRLARNAQIQQEQAAAATSARSGPAPAGPVDQEVGRYEKGQEVGRSEGEAVTAAAPLAVEKLPALQIAELDGADLIRVEQVRLLNGGGEAVDSLAQGERFTIEVVLAGTAALDHVSVGIVIKDRLGLDLTGESVFNRFRRGFSIRPGNRVVARFSAANNLRDGQYSVEVIVNRVSKWDRSDNLVLYTNPVALAFRVLQDPEHPVWFRFRHDFEVSVR